MKFLKSTVLILPMLIASLSHATEEPEFEVLTERDDYEVRLYSPYIVAEVVVTGGFKDSGNAAFRILADYIFGNNSQDSKMSMTAPVQSREIGQGEKMAMTAPVLSSEVDGDSSEFRYAFVIERQYSMDTVPKPLDDRIELREMPARTMAVRRYSGFWSRENYEKNRDVLLEAIARDEIRIIGQPYLARYNAPFTPWFMRRNEVLVEIETEASE